MFRLSTLFWPSLLDSQRNSDSTGAGGMYAAHRATNSGPTSWWPSLASVAAARACRTRSSGVFDVDRQRHQHTAEPVAGDAVR